MINLKGKNILITGAEKGLGFSMAEGLSEYGANIIVLGRGNKSNIKKVVEQNGSKFLGLNIDLLDFSQIKPTIKTVIDKVKNIDVLINNAGVTPINKAEKYTFEQLNEVIDLNLKSLYILTQEVGKHMITNKYGKIINIASIQSIIGGKDVSAYVASKHAVSGLTKALANEWGPKGINVNALAPGFMVTDNTKKLRSNELAVKSINSRIPLKRWGNPDDLVGPIIFLSSDMSNYVNGHTLVVDGGYINN